MEDLEDRSWRAVAESWGWEQSGGPEMLPVGTGMQRVLHSVQSGKILGTAADVD